MRRLTRPEPPVRGPSCAPPAYPPPIGLVQLQTFGFLRFLRLLSFRNHLVRRLRTVGVHISVIHHTHLRHRRFTPCYPLWHKGFQLHRQPQAYVVYGQHDAIVAATQAASDSGSEIVKVDPSPSWDHTEIVPPHSCTQCLTIDSPSPVPPVALERAGSTR